MARAEALGHNSERKPRNPAPRPEVASCNINYRRNACLGPPVVFIATESRSLFV